MSPIKIKLSHHIPDALTYWIKIHNDTITIRKGYCWDGASGCAIDTKDFMKGSIIHDAIYQLIKIEHLPLSSRKNADRILQDICINEGMPKWRANYVYWAVRRFGGIALKKGKEPEIIEV